MGQNRRSGDHDPEVKFRRNRQLTQSPNYNQPWILFILVYLSSLLVQSTHSFVPLKEKPSQPTSNHLLHSSSSLPSYASFIASINDSIINANKQIPGETTLGGAAKKNPNGFRNSHNEKINFPINERCNVDSTLTKVLCQGLRSRKELPMMTPYFLNVVYAEFVDVNSPEFVKRTLSTYSDDVSLEDIYELFPNLVHLNVNHSPGTNLSMLTRRMNHRGGNRRLIKSMALVRDDGSRTSNDTKEESSKESIKLEGGDESAEGDELKAEDEDASSDETLEMNDEATISDNQAGKTFRWESVQYLNLSWNKLKSEQNLFGTIMDTFPNLQSLDVSNNFVSEVVIDLTRIPHLRSIDVSGKLEKPPG